MPTVHESLPIIGARLARVRSYAIAAAVLFVLVPGFMHLADDAMFSRLPVPPETRKELDELLLFMLGVRYAIFTPVAVLLLVAAAFVIRMRGWWLDLAALIATLLLSGFITFVFFGTWSEFDRHHDWLPRGFEHRQEMLDWHRVKLGALGLASFVGHAAAIYGLFVLLLPGVRAAFAAKRSGDHVRAESEVGSVPE